MHVNRRLEILILSKVTVKNKRKKMEHLRDGGHGVIKR